jgi:hypothetical protein
MARDRSDIRFHQTADVPQAETIMTTPPCEESSIPIGRIEFLRFQFLKLKCNRAVGTPRGDSQRSALGKGRGIQE